MSIGQRELVRSFKTRLACYRAVYCHPRTPWMAKGMLWLALSNATSPVDLVPDFIPVLGHLDDLVIVPGSIALALWLIPPDVAQECANQDNSGRKQPSLVSVQIMPVRVPIFSGLTVEVTPRSFIPMRGWSEPETAGGPLYDPAVNAAFIAEVKSCLRKNIPVIEVDAHICDAEFARAVISDFHELMQASGLSHHPGAGDIQAIVSCSALRMTDGHAWAPHRARAACPAPRRGALGPHPGKVFPGRSPRVSKGQALSPVRSHRLPRSCIGP
jgi:uncharacterized membrane protein YkvA (DUF1232 family)